jgi:exosortase B
MNLIETHAIRLQGHSWLKRQGLAWVLLFVAMLLVYAPTVVTLWNGVWQEDRQSHGPVLLMVSIWLFWHGLRRSLDRDLCAAQPWWGWLLLSVGLGLHALGRSQSFVTLEVLSALPVTMGMGLLCGGPRLLKDLSFCFFFLLFLVPLPDLLADALTQPLKLAVSYAAEQVLRWSGHLVARNGVILVLPPYRLMVADACSGMSSLFMLEAFGLLYLNVVKHTSVLRNMALAVLIVPISFTSNVLRVLTLAVLTVHEGDVVAGGVFHALSGLILFVPAFMLTVGLDAILRRWSGGAAQPVRLVSARPATASPPTPMPLATGLWVCLGAMVSVGMAAAWTVAPDPAWVTPPGLGKAIPERFAQWQVVDAPLQVNPAVSLPGSRTQKQPYDEVVMRTYRDPQGRQVMLAVAYAYQLQQEVKIHRPAVCYAAQGFDIKALTPVALGIAGGLPDQRLAATRMEVSLKGRDEVVLYWIRVGDQHSESVLQSRLLILARGLRGQPTDGVLVRVSALKQPGEDATQVGRRLEGFLRDLYRTSRQGGSPVLKLLW